MAAFLESAVVLFSSGTLGYLCALTLRLPAYSAYIIGMLFLAVFVWIFKGGWVRASRRISRQAAQRHIVLILLCLLAGFFELVSYRPNDDDLNFLHRALIQMQNISEPIIINNTTHELSGLPPISYLHLATFHEFLAASMGSALSMDPVWFYQVGFAFIMGLMFPLIYYCLMRELGVNAKHSNLGIIVLILFLLLDGNSVWTFGNYSLIRLWQGKVFLISALLPCTFMFALRYLRNPTGRNLTIIMLTGVSALGLSGSAVFLFPSMLFALTLAYIAGSRFRRNRLPRALALNLGSAACVLTGVIYVAGIIPSVDTTSWHAWEPNWWKNLNLIMKGGKYELARNVLFVFLVPLTALMSGLSRARYVLVYHLALVILFTNPLTGPVLIGIVFPAAYWRFGYLYMLPLCVGLLPRVTFRALHGLNGTRKTGIDHGRLRYCVALSCVALCVLTAGLAFKSPTISGFRKPSAHQFRPYMAGFSESFKQQLSGRIILAPHDIVAVLGLMEPSSRFIVERLPATVQAFSSIGEHEAGERRMLAQLFVENKKEIPAMVTMDTLIKPTGAEIAESFRHVIRNTSVDTIVAVKEMEDAIERILPEMPGNWKRIDIDIEPLNRTVILRSGMRLIRPAPMTPRHVLYVKNLKAPR
jgi:hypothetical protein